MNYSGLLNLQKYFAPMIETLKGEELITTLDKWLKNLICDLNIQVSTEIKIGLISHLASKIDKVSNSKGKPIDEKNRFEGSAQQLIDSIVVLENIYNFSFNSTDIEHINKYLYRKPFI